MFWAFTIKFLFLLKETLKQKDLSLVREKVTEEEIARIKVGDGNYCKKRTLLDSMILSCKAVIRYANRYAQKARELAKSESDITRKA